MTRRFLPFWLVLLALSSAALAQDVVVGANVNMVSGTDFPNGDPFQRQQNEPSVAFSSRNSLHLLAGANDYRAVDVPGLPGGRETGDSWLSYFWSTNGGATWRSTLIPGYPQDPACQGPNPPTLCGYAAGADPVVRAGVNGMFYYSGIVFERTDPTRSAIFVSRFIDLNNDEGGDPIRYLDTVLIDTNEDGAVFLDKSWIGVDVPRGPGATRIFSATQRGGSQVTQTVSCGNVYVGYAAIGGEGEDLRSEIRLATSTDCGDSWTTQLISEPDSLNQGAHIGIDPTTGALHVVWRRFDTVETFLGIPAAGCPSDAASWEVSEVWPVSSLTVAGVSYTMEEAQELLATKHKGDESIKVVKEVIAAKLNLLTGGGDAAPGFNPNVWGQQLSGFIAEAEAWLADNPVGSDPKNPEKQVGMDVKKDIQEILLGSGTCSGSSGTPGGTTGWTNAILVASSNDGGATFGAPRVVAESATFDQGSTTFSFRTTAYPAVTVDDSGRIYAAWAARGYAADQDATGGDARIVLSTSADGTNWSTPYSVDEPNRPGHQIKPSLLFAGGQLTLVFYDFRHDVSNVFESFVVDLPEPDRLRHTVDVRLATALPAAAPVFTDYSLISGTNEPTAPSAQASRYEFLTASADDFGGAGDVTMQAEYMVPNFPMFADGTTPFIGDYVDIAAPNLIYEEGSGWRFATGAGEVQVWQAVWADNRDVIPPPDGDWSKYVAPITQPQVSFFDPTVTLPSCNDVIFTDAPPQWQSGSLYTGTRNQNVYSASITQGLIVAAPGNNRPLVDSNGDVLERAFVVYVQNATDLERSFLVTLQAPAGVAASFTQGGSDLTLQRVLPPYSSAAETVYVTLTGTPSSETVEVLVSEVGGSLTGAARLNTDPEAPAPLALSGTSLFDAEIHNPAILNPAILNPAILNVAADPSLCTSDPTLCVQNPAILNPAILNPAILNPAILNPAIFNPAIFNPAIFNPAILNPAILNPAIFNPAIFNPAIFNPAILNPAILNPAIMNPAILNPAILNPAILNPAILNPAILNPAILNPAILNTSTGSDSQQVDVTFAVRNDGNATTAYDLDLAAQQLAGLDYQVLVYELNETPTTDGCTLTTEAQQQLIFVQDNPLQTPLDGTFYLEPGEEILVTFRVTPDTSSPNPGDPVQDFDVADLSGVVVSQPPNTNGTPQPPDDSFGNLTTGPSLWSAEGDALDSLGFNDGTLEGGTGFDGGRIGQAFELANFPAGSQYVRVLDDPSLQMTDAVTMVAWIYPTSAGVGNHPIVVNKEGEYEFSRRADGSIEWAFAGPGGVGYNWVQGAPAGTAPLDTWTHVAVTFDNGTVVTYVNGLQTSSVSGRPTPIGDFYPGDNELWIGSRQTFAGNSGWFDGRIDEVGIYPTALTPSEVQALFDAAPPFTVSSFDPSVVFSGTSPAQLDALDAAVGTTGYVIEDFEDLTLVPGLTISGGAFGLNSQSTFPSSVWDGTSYFTNQVLNGLVFDITGGTSSFGIGLADIDVADVNLFVNGQDYGSIMEQPNWVKLGDNVRDVYLRIDAVEGELITSVEIRQLTAGFNDGIFFDRVAIAPTPIVVPGTAGGTLLGSSGTAPVSAGTFVLGQQVTLSATGSVEYGPGLITGPDGYGAACPSNCVSPGDSAISLVARIGGGPWQFVGTGPTVLTATSAGALELAVNDNFHGDNLGFFEVTVTPGLPGPVITSSVTEPIRPGTGYVTLDFDPSAPLPANWQALGWQILADDGSLFGPQNLWGQTATRITFRPFSTRLPAGADVPGGVYFADSGGTPVSNVFPVTFSQTPGAPAIEALYLADNPPSLCGGPGPVNLTLLADGDSAPAGSWLAVDLLGVDTSAGGVAVFDGVDTADCGVTQGGVNVSLRKYVQVPAGVPASYSVQWRAGQSGNYGPPSAARTLSN